MTDQTDDPAAYWEWRRSTARNIFDRMVDANLQHLEEAVTRVNKGSYGFEDYADDLRSAWSRSSRDVVDLGRAMFGLTPRPDDVASVTATIDQGSQTSGPIFFTCKSRFPMDLEIRHLHQLHEGEITGEPYLASPDNFRFEPNRLAGDFTPTQVVLRLVGLNQYDGDPDRPTKATELPKGRYIGFIGGTVPRDGNRIRLDHHGDPLPNTDFDVIAVLLLYVVEPHASLTVES